ncbi:hypothetical protein FRC08_016539 [Ceratobasidium sp. 394]|nr:hypothetical protein FRC08_016539 [Ceratobasidium sp. 394]
MPLTNAIFCPLGDYRARSLCVDPRHSEGKSLPDDEHFHAFFSKFGTILGTCRYNSSQAKRDHVYLTFKSVEAVRSLKKYLRVLDETSFWKESCRISFRPVLCPQGLIKQIEANSSAVASSPDVTPGTRRKDKKLLGEPKTKDIPIKVGISKQT